MRKKKTKLTLLVLVFALASCLFGEPVTVTGTVTLNNNHYYLTNASNEVVAVICSINQPGIAQVVEPYLNKRIRLWSKKSKVLGNGVIKVKPNRIKEVKGE